MRKLKLYNLDGKKKICTKKEKKMSQSFKKIFIRIRPDHFGNICFLKILVPTSYKYHVRLKQPKMRLVVFEIKSLT